MPSVRGRALGDSFLSREAELDGVALSDEAQCASGGGKRPLPCSVLLVVAAIEVGF